MWATLTPAYTLECVKNGSNSTYDKTYDVTINGLNWNAPGNQNNTGFWRIGGKSLTNENRVITGKSAIGDAIVKITVNHKGKSRANVTVHSVTLTVASDADFTANVQEVVVSSPTVKKSTDGSFDIVPTSPATEWATGCYYKFTINISNSDSSNGGFDLASIVFYKEVSGEVATVTFADDAPNVAVGETYTNTPTKDPEGLVMSYSSDHTDIATVNSSTGEVTGVAAGTARITASWDAQTVSGTDYAAGSASYDINVVTALAEEYRGTYIRVTDPVVLAADDKIIITSADGTKSFGVQQSSNFAQTSVTKAGANYINVTSSDGDLKVFVLGGAEDAWTFKTPDDKYLYAASTSSNHLKTKDAATETDAQATITIDESGNATIKFNDDTKRRYLRYNSGSSVFSCYTNATDQSDIQIYKLYASPVTATITAATWASFSNASALDFTGTGVTAYIAKTKDANNVTLTEIAKVPASTGIVVNAPAGTYAIPVLTGEADATTGNLLKANLTPQTLADTYYTLAVDGSGNPMFKKSTGVGTLAAGKAYLDLTGGAPELSVDFGGTTGINAVNGEGFKVNGEYYNLAGQRVANPTKGLYIVNGKKVIVK